MFPVQPDPSIGNGREDPEGGQQGDLCTEMQGPGHLRILYVEGEGRHRKKALVRKLSKN